MIDKQQGPVFTDEELQQLLYDLWYPSYHFKGVPTKEYALVKRVRDAVEEKMMRRAQHE
jgi:hypothetical protein